ncbi:hypothetical protein MBLNU459_g4786t3 [Dothideomycetes sp. NU459]
MRECGLTCNAKKEQLWQFWQSGQARTGRAGQAQGSGKREAQAAAAAAAAAPGRTPEPAAADVRTGTDTDTDTDTVADKNGSQGPSVVRFLGSSLSTSNKFPGVYDDRFCASSVASQQLARASSPSRKHRRQSRGRV